MSQKPPTADELIAFFLAHIEANGTTRGMKDAAAGRWRVDRRALGRWIDGLRQRRKIGRDVFRAWRDSGGPPAT